MKTTLLRLSLNFIALTFLTSQSLSAQTITIDNSAKISVAGDGLAAISCDGSINIKGTLDLQNKAILKLKGDFIKNGTPATFSPGNSTVIFEGSGPSQISGGNIANKTTYSFYNLELNMDASSSSVSINTTNINAYVTIVNVLNPANGTLTTNDALNLNNRSTSPGYARIASGNGIIDGGVRVEKRLANTNSNYRQMALPISINTPLANPNWGSFSNGITALLSASVPSAQNNVFIWDSRDADGIGGDDYAHGWRNATQNDNTDSSFNIFLSNNGVHNFGLGGSDAVEFNVFGEIKQGDFAHSLHFTRDPGDNPPTAGFDPVTKGWNLIPNPWVALIDVRKLLIDNVNFTSEYKAIHVWDASAPINNGAVYRAILLNGVTQRTYNTSNSPLDTTVNLAPFQSFWVKATAEGQVCNLISSEIQVTKNTGNNFLKQDYDLFRINAFDQDSLSDQLVIYFNEQSSRGFDLEGDAYYLKSENKNAPSFYALESSSKASIVSRQPFTTDSVHVAFGSLKDQSKFYLHADFTELGADYFVYLKDKKEGKTYLLENGKSILFNHLAGTNKDRFVIYYSPSPRAFSHLVSGNEATIFAFIKNNQLSIQSMGVSGNAQVNIFDAVGRLIQNNSVFVTQGETVTLEKNPTGNLIIVEIIVNGRAYRDRVIF